MSTNHEARDSPIFFSRAAAAALRFCSLRRSDIVGVVQVVLGARRSLRINMSEEMRIGEGTSNFRLHLTQLTVVLELLRSGPN